MPSTTFQEFLQTYSAGSSADATVALHNAIGAKFGRSENMDEFDSPYTEQMQTNLWKYGPYGQLVQVPYDQASENAMMQGMLNGEIYVMPALNENGEPDFSKLTTMTATKHNDNYYVQIMNAQEAKTAYDNRPQSSEPTWIDRLVDFFCRLVGSRDSVCALWDEAHAASRLAALIGKGSTAGTAQEAEPNLYSTLEEQLLNKEFKEQRPELTEEQKAQHLQEAKKLIKENNTMLEDNFNPELVEWYRALYGRTHDLFPTYISVDAETQMNQMDQQALSYAEGKIAYSEYQNRDNTNPYIRLEGHTGVMNGFDVRGNFVTTLAFALSADQNLSAEDVFKFLAGENVPGTEGLQEKMAEQMAKLNDPETRNSKEMQALIQQGTTRMCTLLENQQDLQSAVSYQLGRTLYRNTVSFGDADPESRAAEDPEVKLKLSPVARDIVKLQNAVINSYTTTLMGGFTTTGIGNSGEDYLGAALTHGYAVSMLPMVAEGHTNAAFLEKVSALPPEERLQFLKTNMYVLDDMNKNMRGFVIDRLKGDPDCEWVKSPENLKMAMNGGIVNEYHQEVNKSLKETGKMPTYGKFTGIENLDLNESFAMDMNGSFMGG